MLNEVKDYISQKEDNYMLDYVLKKAFDNQNNFLIYGLNVNFPRITQ